MARSFSRLAKASPTADNDRHMFGYSTPTVPSAVVAHALPLPQSVPSSERAHANMQRTTLVANPDLRTTLTRTSSVGAVEAQTSNHQSIAYTTAAQRDTEGSIDPHLVEAEHPDNTQFTSAEIADRRSSHTPEPVMVSFKSPQSASAQCRLHSAAALPENIRDTLSAWFSANGATMPPPCGIHDSSVTYYERNAAGAPAVFVHKSGETMNVQVFRFGGFTKREARNFYFIVASSPVLGSWIIGTPKDDGTKHKKAYRVWEGISALNSDGWSAEETIFKSFNEQVKRLPGKSSRSYAHVPLIDVHPLGATKANPRAGPGQSEVGTLPGTDVLHIGLQSQIDRHSSESNSVKSSQNDDRRMSSLTREAQGLSHSSNALTDASPTSPALTSPHLLSRAVEALGSPATDHPATIEDEKYFRDDIPAHLKLLLEQWTVHHGSKDLLPCALLTMTWKAIFQHHRKGYFYDFRHVDGSLLDVRLHRLSKATVGSDKAFIIIAEGLQVEPCIIGFRKQIRTSHGIGMLYHVWRGTAGEGSDGFEVETPIVKAAPDEMSGILEALRDRKTESTPVPPAPASNANVVTVHLRTSTSAQDQGKPTPLPIATKLFTEEFSDSLPGQCQKLIDEWFRHHPRYDYSTLPCATASGPNTVLRGSASGTIMSWKYKDGRALDAGAHALPQVPGRPRKRVIIVRGENLGPWMVAHKPGPDKTTLHGAAKIWTGIKGDEYGFEADISVFKDYTSTGVQARNARILNASKSWYAHASDNVKNADVPAAKRPHFNSDGRKLLIASSSKIPILESAITTKVPLATLRPHLLHNLVCLFYAQHVPTPRVRLFSACDTSQKLFAQAMAGELFESSEKAKRGNSVLRIRFGMAKALNTVLVEDDEDDFEALFETIAATGWFSEEGGGIAGSGTIEVRAVS
jgi:hypothetical protein